ncbi:MAG: sigma 54-interacting transcriptional regulator [Polyangiaceae bacterium]
MPKPKTLDVPQPDRETRPMPEILESRFVPHGDDDAATSATTTIARKTTSPLGVRVRILGANATPKQFRLDEGRCVIGSGSSSDVVIAEPTISRQHVELALVPEGVSVRDLGSRNGTYYLGQRVERMVLALGASLTVGNATIVLDADVTALDAGPLAEERFRGLVGRSLAMRRLFATLARLEGSLVNVLVVGESGVGKELVANALHEGSKIADGPFVAVNCGAVPRELVASELFGHKRGAFTGAAEARRGAFDSANGGTLFLDEIGELPLDVQPMLLRALESGEVRPVGGDHVNKVRVRVVAATNRDLEKEVREGRFREDLYYRLAVVKLAVPPLRERPEDVEILAEKFASSVGLDSIPRSVLEDLKTRNWSGNARELRNAVQAFAALGTLPEASGSSTAALDAALSALVRIDVDYASQKEALCDRFTRIYLQALTTHTRGNQTAAAKIAGLDRSYLGRLIVKHGVTKS